MPAENTGGERKGPKQNNRYRLVIMNDETFGEIVSYRLTKVNVYLLVSSILVVLATIVTLFIFFTPLRQYVPGYGDVNLRREIIDQYEIIDSLAEAQRAYEAMFNSRRVQLSDDPASLDGEKNYKDQSMADSAARAASIDPEQVSGVGDTLAMLMEGFKKGKPIFELPLTTIGGMFDPTSMNFVSPLSPMALATQAFAPETGHYGIDLADAKDTPVKAVLSGTVICATWSYQDGYMIAVQHRNNYISFYKHNSKLLKKVGNVVKAGEAIAIIGSTGNHSSGPHLHFELWYNGQAVNPSEYVKF
jgi:murein DD-endopeptidase MepM/ murein hydrolase activator NlpD